ncbi:hypothetical protein MTR67_034185 [Solanum verrucosum]|uniref:NB-ARC domain-containing protein n=1 Tax=Solanum verrucosum TaxID=315347 RepID=A0AAF0U7R3_SOLVR|nr:hypothetical protein MTR67_034185 [Solanum verrucosum]
MKDTKNLSTEKGSNTVSVLMNASQNKDDQTYEDSQLSELNEDEQTDEYAQISKQDEDDQNDRDSRIFKLAHLLLKIIPTELEVMHICYTNLKDSTSAEIGRFIKKILETSPDILWEYLIHLQEHMITVITPSTLGARKIHVMIEFLLIILFVMPNDFIHHDKLFDFLAFVGALIKEVSTLVRDLEEKLRNKESTDETNRATLKLLEIIEILKEDLKHVYLKVSDLSQCCFPMSDGPLFMHLLQRHLDDLLDSNAYSIALIKEQIRLAKDVIDSIIVRDNGLLHLIFSLPITRKKIKLIKEDISNLHEKIPENRGFEEKTNLILRKLTSGPADLDVISITGMPGSGKTTLAYKVKNDKSVSSHFELRAWCTVDQGYAEKKLLDKIFNQVSDSNSILSENIDVTDKLRKQLYGKKYLISLDDVWDTTTWDELIRPFPEVEKGSRIILTTRKKEVALHGKLYTAPLNLRLLRSKESWELLEKKEFDNESFPDDLLDVGKEIAENCKGLLLVADLNAGVIARREKKRTVSLEVQNNLSSFILNSEVEVMKVIKLSYDHLPHHLKPCLLYLASCPKDTALTISLLKAVWSAKGLVEQIEMKSVKEVMDVYMDNLISSSLVILFNEIGDEPSCQPHDLVHDFCFIKAREEKLFEWISSSTPSSSSDLMPRIVTIHYNSELLGLNNFVQFDSNKKRHSGKHMYSLTVVCDDSVSETFQLRHLRLLRYLDLDPSFIKVKDSLLNEICMLNHLRYLCIRTEVKSLPLSFSNLWNLEILLVHNEGSAFALLPRIWDLVKLQVLSVNDSSFFDMDADGSIVIAEDTKLENLRILGKLLVLSYSKDAKYIFTRFPNLQVLVFVLKESWDYSTEQHWFPKFDCLTELENLSVGFKSSNTNDSGSFVATNRPWDFHFPSNLKKLCLLDFPLSTNSLSTIAILPNFEEMTLYDTIIHGEKWNMGEEDTFKNLKCLKLHRVTLSNWVVGEESFPALEKLKLEGCCDLEEIPPSFGDIYSLKIIELVESPQLEDSAMKIKEYAKDMRGGDELQLVGRKNNPLFK